MPSKEECYPTAARKAACFFPKYHKDVVSRCISRGGADQVEWLALLSETRQAAAEGRKKQREQQRLRTDQGAQKQGTRRLDLKKDEKKIVQTTGGKQGGGNGGCVAGCPVSEAGAVPETGESSGWRRFSILPVGGKYKKMGLFKVAKIFGRWVERFYRVTWTPHSGGSDSCFDWVVEFPSGSQHDFV